MEANLLASEITLAPVRAGETFEQYVCRCFARNYAEASRTFNVDYDALRQVLIGHIVPEYFRRMLDHIARVLHADQESLFPRALYQTRLYVSVKECPAYKAIARKYSTHFHSRRNSVKSLLFDRGFSIHEYRMFVAMAMGCVNLRFYSSLCERIALSVDIPLEVLFPSSIYERQTEETRIRASYGSLYIDDEPEAIEKMERGHDYLNDTHQRVWGLLQELISRLPPQQAEVIRLRYAEGLEYNKIAETLQLNSHQHVGQIHNAALESLQWYAGSYREEYKELCDDLDVARSVLPHALGFFTEAALQGVKHHFVRNAKRIPAREYQRRRREKATVVFT